jgi:hypothetical protein
LTELTDLKGDKPKKILQFDTFKSDTRIDGETAKEDVGPNERSALDY